MRLTPFEVEGGKGKEMTRLVVLPVISEFS
jgi:hypothetical protein